MKRFATLASLRDELGDRRTWEVVAAACERASGVLPEVTFSLGDAVTYRVTDRPECVHLTGHRRYLEARFVLDGLLSVDVAPVDWLDPVDEYSDLTDRRHFVGGARRHRVRAGEFVVVDGAEAIRDVSLDGRMVVLRIAAENA